MLLTITKNLKHKLGLYLNKNGLKKLSSVKDFQTNMHTTKYR